LHANREVDSIYFRYTPLHQNGFEKVYTDDKDALRRVKYDAADLFSDPCKNAYHQYVFLRDLKMLEALDMDAKKK
jgi:hypothetical protein